MEHSNISTSTLLQRLFKTSNISGFIKRYGGQMKKIPFKTYLNNLCVEKSAVAEHVIKKSGIERTYGHQIFNGTRRPSRDKVIQLAMGFELNYAEAQELLRAARKSPLYPKVERDAVVIYALNKGLSEANVQVTLKELSLPLLGKEDRYE